MDTPALAGAIELTPAETALLLGIVVGAELALLAPGWLSVVIAAVVRRRRSPHTTPALVGAGATGGLAGLVLAGLGQWTAAQAVGWQLAVVGGWLCCWPLAAVLLLRTGRPAEARR